MDPSRLTVFVLPEWMQVSLKSQDLNVTDVLDWDSGTKFSTIFSGNDVNFHDDVTYKVNELLFGSDLYQKDKAFYEEKFKELKDAWFALPFQTDTTLNLHPVVLGTNLIGIVNHKGDDTDKVCETDIYERLLHCMHRLTTSRIGMRAWDSELTRNVLEKIRVSRSAA